MSLTDEFATVNTLPSGNLVIMARVVEVEVGATPSVDWAAIADGRTYELRRGEDFQQEARLARRAAISWSLRRGLHARSSVPDTETLIIRFDRGADVDE